MSTAGDVRERSRPPVRRRKRRDTRRAKRRIRTSHNVFRFIRWILTPPMDWYFRLRGHNTELFSRVRPPFVILANHACFLDPFFLARFVPYAVHYVVSDSNFRSRLVDMGLHLVGGIPKTKALSDLETVKRIVQIKAKNGVIGVFPEGQSTWDGHSLPIYYATAKLLKSLKVPVVTTLIEGSFFSLPRWGRRPRRGRVDVSFELTLTPGMMRSMSVDEIYEQILARLDHDEFVAQKQRQVPFTGGRRAEYLEIVLFVCPECRSIGTIHSEGDRVSCSHCAYSVHMDRYGFFRPDSGPLHFETLRSWNLWQVQHFEKTIDRALESDRAGEEILLSEEGVRIREGYKSQPLEFRALGRLSLSTHELRMDTSEGRGEPLSFRVDEIEGINVQNSEFLEFYYQGALYQVTILARQGNSYKWNLAVRHLQGRAKETLKRERAPH